MNVKIAVAGSVVAVAYFAFFAPSSGSVRPMPRAVKPVSRGSGSGSGPSVEPVSFTAENQPWASYTYDDLDQFEDAWLVLWRDSWGMPVHLWDRSAVNHVEDQTQVALALMVIDPETLASQYHMTVEEVREQVVGRQEFTSLHPDLNEADRYLLGRIEEAAGWVSPGGEAESWFSAWWPF